MYSANSANDDFVINLNLSSKQCSKAEALEILPVRALIFGSSEKGSKIGYPLNLHRNRGILI